MRSNFLADIAIETASAQIQMSTMKANGLSGTSQVGNVGYIAARDAGAALTPLTLGMALMTAGPMLR